VARAKGTRAPRAAARARTSGLRHGKRFVPAPLGWFARRSADSRAARL